MGCMSTPLFALEAGEGGVPLVFLHGFGSTHANWNVIQAAFAGSRRTIAYDLPGHGGSLQSSAKPYPKAMAQAILADLAGRGVKDFHLAGHSLGGSISCLIAFVAPASVSSMTLLAPGGFGSEVNGRLLARFAAARDADTVRNCLEEMFGWSNPVSEHSVAFRTEMRQKPRQTEALVTLCENIARNGRQGAIPREQIAALDMPVKVLWGTQDRVLPTRQAHRLPGHIAGHIFEETGHMLVEEIPDAVIRLIRENIRAF
jgi:pyruvate dehydrogenase E2 component (dihydrolipoamide acetyltransferase)